MSKFKLRLPVVFTKPWVDQKIPAGVRQSITQWMARNPRRFGSENFAPGSRNPLYNDLVVDPFINGGNRWVIKGNFAECEVDDTWLADDLLELIQLISGSISGLTAFAEITDPSLPIPVAIGGNGTRTWEQYFPTHPLQQYGDLWYVALVKNRRGEPIDYDVLLSLDDPNVRVIRVAEMRAIVAANPPDDAVVADNEERPGQGNGGRR